MSAWVPACVTAACLGYGCRVWDVDSDGLYWRGVLLLCGTAAAWGVWGALKIVGGTP
jgi:hypothetical protein